ncbi:hypothetical protein BDZ97DRAFT_1776207 [Flammula alnicola]|nr:hypothetical protein BDZ97DRAFT_1776207 [Flammula alnicola]
MPRRVTPYAAVPLDPAEYVSFDIPTGKIVQLPVFVDRVTNKELVQCDICGRYCPLTSKRSTVTLRKHRGTKGCSKQVQRKRRHEEQDQVNAEANAALDALFKVTGSAEQPAPRGRPSSRSRICS